MYYDDLLTDYLGDFGRYQLLVFILVALVNFPVAFNTMGIVFLAGVPEHWCRVPGIHNLTDTLNLDDGDVRNLTIPYDSKDGYETCNMYGGNYSFWTEEDISKRYTSDRSNLTEVSCEDGWFYSQDVYTSTIVSDWDLVCENRYITATSKSIYMAGFMIGVMIAGNVSDIFGRRPVYAVTLIILIVSGILTTFSPNPTTFLIMRFINALGNIGASSTGYVIATEIMGPTWRAHSGMMYQYFWAVGYLSFAVFAYFIRDWKTLQLVTSALCVVLLPTIIFLPESPRWLYTRKRTTEADKLVRKMAKVNRKRLPETLNIEIKTDKRGYFIDLWKHPRMRLRTLNVMFNWFVSSLVYYGLSWNTSNLGGNDFINFAISAGVEIPAYIISQAALVYIGRRIPLAASLIIGGICLIINVFIPKSMLWLAISFAMLGKMCISGSFAMVGIVTLEVFPTVTRHVGLASGSVAARVAGILAPYIELLNVFGFWVPMVLFATLSITAGILALFFPETKGKQLAETVEEGENFGLKEVNQKVADVKVSGETKSML